MNMISSENKELLMIALEFVRQHKPNQALMQTESCDDNLMHAVNAIAYIQKQDFGSALRELKLSFAFDDLPTITEIFKFILKRIYEHNNILNADRALQGEAFKVICLGRFLYDLGHNLEVNNLSMLTGSSGVLDYAFLKALAIKFNVKNYLEIGAWFGESISNLADVAENCISISLEKNDPRNVEYIETNLNKENFCYYFSEKKNNIKSIFADTKTFDFSTLNTNFDLVFIDGDHSYEGVRNDTEKVFNIIDPEHCIVVWHDFKNIYNKALPNTINAVIDALSPDMLSRIHLVDTNICGIYLPKKYSGTIPCYQDRNEIFSYNIKLNIEQNHLGK